MTNKLPKIDWDNAPEGTTHHANDEDGRGFYYKHAPVVSARTWEESKSDYVPFGVDLDGPCEHWRETFQARPDTQEEQEAISLMVNDAFENACIVRVVTAFGKYRAAGLGVIESVERARLECGL